MQSKKYRVWMTQNYLTDLNAERMEIVAVNDKPIKIKFLTNDNVIAEFYCDAISGWAQVDCLVYD